MKPKYCYIFRGLPGSGKSTVVSLLQPLIQADVASADHYFSRSGEYQFDAAQLEQAHAYCHEVFFRAVKAGRSVIVDNTCSKLREYEAYYQAAVNAGYEVRIIEIEIDSFETLIEFHRRNVHTVPWSTMTQMVIRWEDDPRAVLMRSSDIHLITGGDNAS